MHLPPAPDPRELLPPLLACLPTSFISPRPPPALLPLLSPLLRQRVAFLSSTIPAGADPSSSGGSRNTEGWLPLLCWESSRAANLSAVVENIELEPHPVSGELELEDVEGVKFRRLDEETLQARLEVEQFGLTPVYVWCESDEHAGSEGSGAGWKLAELRALEDKEEGEGVWFEGLVEADERGRVEPVGVGGGRTLEVPGVNGDGGGQVNGGGKEEDGEEEEDDDDYWASYDRTPGRGPTPAKQSPAPPGTQGAGARGRSQSELDYYARYGSEVQPALDAHDPDEENGELGQSTLNGDSLVRRQAQEVQQQQQQSSRHLQPEPAPDLPDERPLSRPNGASMFPADTSASNAKATDTPLQHTVSQPRPISPTDSQNSIEKLEREAAAMSGGGGGGDRAQAAITQHIKTDIKSLFRLARGTGMERGEFERVVRTELECLGFLEENDG